MKRRSPLGWGLPVTVTGCLAVVGLAGLSFLLAGSLPASIPDCHSERAKAAMAQAVSSDGTAEPLRAVGRSLGPDGEIERYDCEVLLRGEAGQGQRLHLFTLEEVDGRLRAAPH